MTPSEAQSRIAALREEVASHDERYYRQARPEISDHDYDRLKRELAALESKFPGAAKAAGADSPSSSVGDDRAEGFKTYRHRLAMQSLDNTYSEADLREFHARLARVLGRDGLSYVVEPKIDGLAVSLTYEKGRFVRAVTRGNGVEGDDVSANALTIKALPRELKRSAQAPLPDVIEIRGEIYMTLPEFERINAAREEEGEERFANPRSLAAGTIKLLDPREVAQRRLEIVLYGIGACEPAKAAGDTQSGYHARVKAWGLPGSRSSGRPRG
jgi:DNA ligase (NAD+)